MVPSTFFRSTTARSLPVILAALLFAGCGTQTPDKSAAHLEGTAQADSGFYLQQMQQSANDSKSNWQLLAIRALVKEGQGQKALELFNQLPQDMNEAQRREQALLAVEIKVAQHDYPGAQSLLNSLKPADLDQGQQSRYWQAVITTAEGRPSLTLLRALIAQQPLLATADKQKNIDATWQVLASMSPQQVQSLVINADENVLQGWLDLQRVWSENRNDADMMKAGITDWQTRYPQNPGATMLPTPLTGAQNFQPASANKIALLLPLNGQASIFGKTIQQGFEAAKNAGTAPVSPVSAPQPAAVEAQPAAQTSGDVASPAQVSTAELTKQPQTPPAETAATGQAVASTPANPGAELKIYDTSAQPLDQVLNQVQQDGASIVVGPLLKNNVEELMKSQTALNVLALNQPEATEDRPNICYFALSPEDEARDAARHIHEQGKQSPLVLVPRSALGDRVTNAFAEEWHKLGGSTVLQQKFGSTAELKMGINGGTGIAMTGSPVSASLPQQQGVTIGGLTIPAAPSEAQITGNGKVDAAYILATPDEIALIKPMITMRTGSQSNVTLYASSRSAQSNAGPDFRLEMEGLQFSEIPMLAGNNPQLMQQALSAVRNDYSLARLYAMGVDAWTLANHFSEMRQMPGFTITGNTGDLSAAQNCVINRKLSWLTYQQGQIVPAS